MHVSDNSMWHAWLHFIPAIQSHHNGCPSVGWVPLTLHNITVATDCVPLRNVCLLSSLLPVISHDECRSNECTRRVLVCYAFMQDGRNALHLAAKGGHVSTIRCLASKMEALLNSTDHEGYTMLHWAAQEGQTEVVQLALEEYRVDVTAVDKVCF